MQVSLLKELEQVRRNSEINQEELVKECEGEKLALHNIHLAEIKKVKSEFQEEREEW